MRTTLATLTFLLVAAIQVLAGEDRTPPKADVVLSPGTSRAWATAAAAVIFERNGLRHDLLAGATLDAKGVEAARELLKDSWEVTSKDQLVVHLDKLEKSGQREALQASFDEVVKFSEKEMEAKADKLPADKRPWFRTVWKGSQRAAKFKGGVLAWDLCRHVALCRWGFAAGFLSEEETWKRLEPVARDLQKAYTSWEEMGEAYCIGYAVFFAGKEESTLAAFEKLKTAEDSPWKRTPWKLKLVSLAKPEKPPAEPRKKP